MSQGKDNSAIPPELNVPKNVLRKTNSRKFDNSALPDEEKIAEGDEKYDPEDSMVKRKGKKRKIKTDTRKENGPKKRKLTDTGEENYIVYDSENGADSDCGSRKSKKSKCSKSKGNSTQTSASASTSAASAASAASDTGVTASTKDYEMPSVQEVCSVFGLNDVKIQYTEDDFRNLTTYKSFCSHVRPILAKENPKAPIGKLIMLIAAKWRDFSSQNWTTQRAESVRIITTKHHQSTSPAMPSVQEVCSSFGLNDVKIQYTEADFRNLTTYKSFCCHVRPILAKENPKASVGKLMMLIAAKWRDFSSQNWNTPQAEPDVNKESDYTPKPSRSRAAKTPVSKEMPNDNELVNIKKQLTALKLEVRKQGKQINEQKRIIKVQGEQMKDQKCAIQKLEEKVSVLQHGEMATFTQQLRSGKKHRKRQI
ncbi:uncharacterized protein LOC135843280 isoform X2 [Planococcus citri]|uniref:uncharacterized protein LOC135843280 isoform X2 n=1 Tax=Planococcus citri TaxID=170843 RepID=UPI0031F79EB4